MKKNKYNYLTPVKELPKKVQNEIYAYMKEGWAMYEAGTGEKYLDRISKKELIENYYIQDIEEQFPVDTLLQELNRQNNYSMEGSEMNV